MKKCEYLINGKPFTVEILSFDGRKADVRVNNVAYSVEVPQGPAAATPAYAPPSSAAPPPAPAEPPRAAAPASPPAPTPAAPPPAAAPPVQASSENMVVAPMPGIILSIAVKEGDQVNAGDVILVLEAMKMENEIHAPRTGIVKKIHVSEGSEVRAGSELVEIE
jgi:biotin carboxyl carrier protein